MASGIRSVGIAGAIIGVFLVASPSFAGLLDPMQFQSLGSLSLTTPGTYVINTSGPNPTLVGAGVFYNGVVSNGIAVFDFSSVSISSGVTVIAAPTSRLPVALLSQTTENINGSINVSASGSQQGPGASNTSVGGTGGIYVDVFGASVNSYYGGGGGGGFGGAGGSGNSYSPLARGGLGGLASANLGFVLQGGSRGGDVGGFEGYGYGGGGGGAIELGASQGITIGTTGFVAAAGGDGRLFSGGGSGGGIFIHAPTVTLHGTLDVQGGAGTRGSNGSREYFGDSGDGGGGAILVDYWTSFSSSGFVNTKPGNGFSGFSSGKSGVYAVEMVPEPSSFILLGTSIFGLIGVAAVRRPRRGIGPHAG